MKKRIKLIACRKEMIFKIVISVIIFFIIIGFGAAELSIYENGTKYLEDKIECKNFPLSPNFFYSKKIFVFKDGMIN